MGDDTEDYFDKTQRRYRWRALHEDEFVFGLVPAEFAELAILDREFGPFTSSKEPSE